MVQLAFNALRQKIWGKCLLPNLRKDFPPHFHNCHTFGMLLQGMREMRINGQWRLIGPYEPVAINPGEVHACRHFGPDACEWASLVLSGAPERKAGGFCALPRLANWPEGSAKDRLAELLASFTEFSAREQDARLREILPALAVEANDGHAAPEKPDPLAEIKIWPGLDRLCQKEGMGKFAWLRDFNARHGISPRRYYDAARLGRACEMLAHGMAPAQCALEAGYCDQSHLNRHFVKYLGYTPGNFQQAMLAAKTGAKTR